MAFRKQIKVHFSLKSSCHRKQDEEQDEKVAYEINA